MSFLQFVSRFVASVSFGALVILYAWDSFLKGGIEGALGSLIFSSIVGLTAAFVVGTISSIGRAKIVTRVVDQHGEILSETEEIVNTVLASQLPGQSSDKKIKPSSEPQPVKAKARNHSAPDSQSSKPMATKKVAAQQPSSASADPSVVWNMNRRRKPSVQNRLPVGSSASVETGETGPLFSEEIWSVPTVFRKNKGKELH